MPNPQWDDFALTNQFQALDKRFEMYEHALEGLSHFPIDVAKAALEIEHLATELVSVRKEVRDVASTCTQMHEEYRQDRDRRQKGRTAIVVAVVTGCFTVLAALVVLIGSLAGAG